MKKISLGSLFKSSCRLLATTLTGVLIATHSYANSLKVIDDTYIDQANPDVIQNQLDNDGRRIVVSPAIADDEKIGLFKYDFDRSLPASFVLPGESVNKATVRIWVSEVITPGDFAIYRVNTIWDEISATYDNTFNEVSSTLVENFSVETTDVDHWVIIDITDYVKEEVSSFQDRGATGFAIRAVGNNPGSVVFSSKEGIYTLPREIDNQAQALSLRESLNSLSQNTIPSSSDSNYLGLLPTTHSGSHDCPTNCDKTCKKVCKKKPKKICKEVPKKTCKIVQEHVCKDVPKTVCRRECKRVTSRGKTCYQCKNICKVVHEQQCTIQDVKKCETKIIDVCKIKMVKKCKDVCSTHCTPDCDNGNGNGGGDNGGGDNGGGDNGGGDNGGGDNGGGDNGGGCDNSCGEPVNISGPTGHPSEIALIILESQTLTSTRQTIGTNTLDEQQFTTPVSHTILEKEITAEKPSTVMMMASLSLVWERKGDYMIECETTIHNKDGKTVTLPLLKKSVNYRGNTEMVTLNGSSLNTDMEGDITTSVYCQVYDKNLSLIEHTANGNLTVWSVPR
ncbi:MAG: DNRLRE domain-containing protein [Pseudomonadota bacterium]